MMKATIPSDDDLRERRSRWGAYAPPRPIRASHVPSVLAGQAPFERIAAEREAVEKAEERLNREHVEWQQRTRLAQAEHSEALRKAVLHGGPMPAPPKLEGWGGAVHTNTADGPQVVSFDRAIFDELHTTLEAQELGLLKERVDDWCEVIWQAMAPHQAALEQALAAAERARASLQPYEAALVAVKGPGREEEVPAEKSVNQFESRKVPITPGETMSPEERFDLLMESRRAPRGRASAR